MPVKLTIRKEEDSSWVDVREFGQAEITIGRGNDNTLWLEDQGKVVSRHHARILFQDDDYFISDLGSRNATLINGSKIMANLRYRLNDGDHIRIGDYTIEFNTAAAFPEETDPTILMVNPFQEDAKILINALRKIKRTYDEANPQTRQADLSSVLKEGLRDADIDPLDELIAGVLFNRRKPVTDPEIHVKEEGPSLPQTAKLPDQDNPGQVIQPFHKSAVKRKVDISLLNKSGSN